MAILLKVTSVSLHYPFIVSTGIKWPSGQRSCVKTSERKVNLLQFFVSYWREFGPENFGTENFGPIIRLEIKHSTKTHALFHFS